MGEKIKSECLTVHKDQVFVSMDKATLLIRTAPQEFYRRYRDNIWVAKLRKLPTRRLFPGQSIHITLWHHGLITKIDAKTMKGWETVYKIDELPEGLTCLAGCATRN